METRSADAIPAAAPTPSVATPQRRRASDAEQEGLLALIAIEDKLRAALLENDRLKAKNLSLARALAEAAQLGIAAHHLAHHDSLTGLPNRLLLTQQLQDSICAALHRHRQLALLFIDLDRFKLVNDRLGHIVGDKLLAIVASRMLAAVRAQDTAYRYGGDEFVVLLSDIGDLAIVDAIAEKIRDRIDGCYGIDGNEVRITASIGFAVYPVHGSDGYALLSHADASMFRRKAARSNLEHSAATAYIEAPHVDER